MTADRLGEVFAGRRCLVTGHTGFKGSWLCIWLECLGAQVTGFALDPPTSPSLFDVAGVGSLVSDLRGDLRDSRLVAEAVEKTRPELVFHLAAQPLVRYSYREPKETFDVNVGGTVNLLEALRNCATVRALVAVTSDKCYENREWVHSYRETDPLGGHDPYSASKGAEEIICASYRSSFFAGKGVGLATARAGNVIGGGDWAEDRIIPDIVRAIGQGRPAEVRNPHSTRPWQHVLDPVMGYLMLGAGLLEEQNIFSGAWNFGPSVENSRTVGQLAEEFISIYGSGSWTDISSSRTDRLHEARFLSLASDKAVRILGWRPRWDFAAAVGNTANWYNRQAAGDNPLALCREDILAYQGNA